MVVIPAVRREHRVKQKHTVAQPRISTVVNRSGGQTIVLVNIKMVCFGRHVRQLASRGNLPVKFSASYKDTPYWSVNGIMFWIVNHYWAKEWIHPNTLKLEVYDCIPHIFVVKCCDLPTQLRLAIWRFRGRSAVAPTDNELNLQAALTFSKDLMCRPINYMEFLTIFKVRKQFDEELGSQCIRFQI